MVCAAVWFAGSGSNSWRFTEMRMAWLK